LELDRILADREMRDCLLMVFANKQDLPGCEFFDHCHERVGGVVFFRRHCLSGVCLVGQVTDGEVEDEIPW